MTRSYSAQKAALTRALNSDDPTRVTRECRRAFAEFDRFGWPDDWARWKSAEDDAIFDIANQHRRTA